MKDFNVTGNWNEDQNKSIVYPIFVHNFLVKKKDAQDSLREYYIEITILAVIHIFIAHWNT